MPEYDLAVIVICSNVGSLIRETHNELCMVLGTLGLNVELIYVDSSSTDDTLYRLRNLQNTASNMITRVVSLRYSMGETSVFMAGLDHSSSPFVLTIDPQLTVDPLEIIRIIEEIEKGYDLVIGWRQRQHLGWFVRSRSRLINRMTSSVTGVAVHDYGSQFRLCRRSLLEDMRVPSEFFQFMPVFAHTAGARIAEMPVNYRPKIYIGPEYTYRSVASSFFDLINVWFFSRFAARPIQLFGSVGIFFILLSFLTLIAAILNREVRGISLILTPLPTLSGLLFAVGVQTILLGLMTEVIRRSFLDLQDKPTYHVREVIEVGQGK